MIYYKMTPIEKLFRSIVQKYDFDKYWRYRTVLVDPSKGNKITDAFRLYYIKRADAFNNSSFGTHRNYGAEFASVPYLPHGLNGIIISHNAKIGHRCVILHQVTIGENSSGAPVIGDNVMIGAGSKIIGAVKIGNNVKIGAGCTVMHDVPDNTVVLPPEPILKASKKSD